MNVHKVADGQNSFISKARVTIGDDATPVVEDTDTLVKITCSCGMYKHTANYCTELIAMAAKLEEIDMEMLLDDMTPRNGVGAPKRGGKKGNCRGPDKEN